MGWTDRQVSWNKQCRTIIRTLLIFLFVMIVSLCFGVYYVVVGKELPPIVTIEELTQAPDAHDRHRVAVEGYILTKEIRRGRMGSKFLFLVIQEFIKAPTFKTSQVNIVADFQIVQREGQRIMVQGTYRKEGRWGGLPTSNYIRAEHIVKG